MASGSLVLEKIVDPTVRWYIYPSMAFQKRIYGNVTATNQTLYLCDDALCIPTRFSGYLSWYDPSTGGVGGRVFPNHGEAWDHTRETNPNTASPYNGSAVVFPGFRGYFIAVDLTDGISKDSVRVLHRYTDGAILVFNTGSPAGLTIRVSDPPSGLGYSVQTNGTRGTGYTDIAPGQYVLFYKGTAPDVDATKGIFATSPLGSSKSYDYEFYVNTFANVPTMWLGIRSREDREIIAFYSYGTFRNTGAFYLFGGSVNTGGINASSYIVNVYPLLQVLDNDPYSTVGRWRGSHVPWQVWMGWGEVDGTVKYAVFSMYATKHTTKWEPRARTYLAILYDFDEDVEYQVSIIKPLVNIYSNGEATGNIDPWLVNIANDYKFATATLVLNFDDTTSKITTAPSTLTFVDNIYGACNYWGTTITCVEGVAVYTDDPNLAISNAKSAWGVAIQAWSPGAYGLRIPPWGDKTLTAGKTYLAVTRQKRFPAGTPDDVLVNWMKSVQPVVLSSTDVANIMSKPPFTAWLFGRNESAASISAPPGAKPGDTITVSVIVDAAYAGKTAYALLVDPQNNVVASSSGTVSSTGTASIRITIPSTAPPGNYTIVAIVSGDRTLP